MRDEEGAQTTSQQAQAKASRLSERLRARGGEIEQAALTRAYAVSDPSSVADPAYLEGLRAAVAAALEYGLSGIESGDGDAIPVPPVLLAQARLAARSGVRLDTVLRRYLTGYTLLGDFVIEEGQKDNLLRGGEIKSLLRAQAERFDRLLVVVSKEFSDEVATCDSRQSRLVDRVERLLEGELLDTNEFPYDFSRHHLGVIACGPQCEKAVRELAAGIDCNLLVVCPSEDIAWAWLGSRSRIDPNRAIQPGPEVSLAVGEPAQSLAGWRRTHRQARAVLPLALRTRARTARYATDAVLAAVLNEPLLAETLHELYIEPLQGDRDGGEVAKETLAAYFAAERNATSAAATLGLSRQAVDARLRAIEERIGRTLGECALELELAIALTTLGKRELAAA